MQETIKEFLKRPIAYQPVTAKAFGSVKLAILWCQLYYWSDKGHDPDGWIYKTRENIYDETGLSRREQETARSLGTELGVLQEERRGENGTMHFRVNIEKAYELVERFMVSQKTSTLFGPTEKVEVKIQTKKTEECACFDEFWKEYPRKENRKKAEMAWKKIKHESHAGIIADVRSRKAKHGQWIAGYVPHATTYINGERWKDEIISGKSGKPDKPMDNYDKARERRYAETDKEIRIAKENAKRNGEGSIGDVLKKYRPEFIKKS